MKDKKQLKKEIDRCKRVRYFMKIIVAPIYIIYSMFFFLEFCFSRLKNIVNSIFKKISSYIGLNKIEKKIEIKKSKLLELQYKEDNFL